MKLLGSCAVLALACSCATAGGERRATTAPTPPEPALPAEPGPSLELVRLASAAPLYVRPDEKAEVIRMTGPEENALLAFRLVSRGAEWSELESLAGRPGYGQCDEAVDPFAGARLRFFARSSDVPAKTEVTERAGEGDATPCGWMRVSSDVRMPGRTTGPIKANLGAKLFWRDGTPAGVVVGDYAFDNELDEGSGRPCFQRRVLRAGAAGTSGDLDWATLTLCLARGDFEEAASRRR